MIVDFIADDVPIDYNDYGVAPYVPFDIKSVTIGPNGLNDTSEGLHFKYWSAYFDRLTSELYIKDIDLDVTTLVLTATEGMIKLALAFDQNGNDTYAYINNAGVLKLRFFDGTIPGDTTLDLGVAQSVTLTMDMKYYPSSTSSDILLFYIRDNAIFYRAQRDRYATEYVTPITDGAHKLIDSGMRKDYRFQVRWS